MSKIKNLSNINKKGYLTLLPIFKIEFEFAIGMRAKN